MSSETKEAPPEKGIAKPGGERTTGGALTRLVPKDFGELEHIAKILANSDIVPKDLRGKAANVLLVLMFGNEIGLTPAQAMQNVMVVNGRPSLWGDAVMGLVESSGQQEWWKDWTDDKNGGTSYFQTKRKGRDPVTRSFSQIDAAKAKLDKKDGPWQEYTARMRFHRARSWALRDVYPDILKGIRYFEEERDTIVLEKSGEKEYAMPAEKIENAPAAAAAAPAPTPAPEPTKEPEGNIVAFKVYGAAESDFNGEPSFVIRDTTEPPVKYWTDNEDYFKLAKSVKGTSKELAGVWIEKASGNAKGRWLSALQLKG